MNRIVWPLLIALNVALAGLLAWQWFTPDGQWRHLRWQQPAAVPPALADVKPLPDVDVDVAKYVATLERPLFLASRRPPPSPEEAAPAPPPDPMPDIRLLGLYGNESAGGIIASIDGSVRRVRVGERIVGQWTLTSRQSNAAVVARGGQERTIVLARNVGAVPDNTAAGEQAASIVSTANASQTTAASERERLRIERTREQVRRMNALRARRGMPPLPEP